jgi:FKBP-type peptidyl-prolyl cis-trans isomerase SlyD
MTVDTIRDGVVVSLAYTLTADNQTIETATAEEPLDYLHGAENIVPGLETALLGKRVGDRFNITLAPEDAYGAYDENDREIVPLGDFPESDNLQEGMSIIMEDEDGYLFDALISKIDGNNVVLDFNPPLAGKSITYDVEVLAIREADDEELAAGQPYGFDDFDDDEYEDDEE